MPGVGHRSGDKQAQAIGRGHTSVVRRAIRVVRQVAS
jgi:hypothetical protein